MLTGGGGTRRAPRMTAGRDEASSRLGKQARGPRPIHVPSTIVARTAMVTNAVRIRGFARSSPHPLLTEPMKEVEVPARLPAVLIPPDSMVASGPMRVTACGSPDA